MKDKMNQFFSYSLIDQRARKKKNYTRDVNLLDFKVDSTQMYTQMEWEGKT